jgi:hypothetical protein
MAGLIATLALGGILWQFQINGNDPTLSPYGVRAWQMAMYFTNITNALIGIHMLCVVFGKTVDKNFSATVTLSIIMVGIIYKVLLAPEVPKQSPDWYPDFFVHVAVPVLTTLWWLIWGDKTLRIAHLPIWLSLPAAYCAYALVRGAVTGVYPYFFFDVAKFGIGQVLVNCVGLVCVFGLCGTLVWLTSRLMR